MSEAYPTPRGFAWPYHRPLRALAASCLIGTLAADGAYALTADFLWADFADWLIALAAVIGVLSLIVGVLESLTRRLWPRPAALSVLFDLLAWVFACADLAIHTRDSWTSVMPWGLTLSAFAVLMLIVSEWTQRTAPEPVIVERTV